MAYTPPTSVNTNFTISDQVTSSLTQTGFPSPLSSSQNLAQTMSYSKGIAAGQVDTVGVGLFTVAFGATQNIFLSTATPTLTDTYGQATIFARVKSISIYLLASPAAVSIHWGTGTTPFLGPAASAIVWTLLNGSLGGQYGWGVSPATAYAVTAGVNDRINVTNDDGALSATFKIVVKGGAT